MWQTSYSPREATKKTFKPPCCGLNLDSIVYVVLGRRGNKKPTTYISSPGIWTGWKIEGILYSTSHWNFFVPVHQDSHQLCRNYNKGKHLTCITDDNIPSDRCNRNIWICVKVVNFKQRHSSWLILRIESDVSIGKDPSVLLAQQDVHHVLFNAIIMDQKYLLWEGMKHHPLSNHAEGRGFIWNTCGYLDRATADGDLPGKTRAALK